MKNPRISPQEHGLIIAAIRRVFSRSDLRRTVVEGKRIDNNDVSRPRVTRWSICEGCQQAVPTYTTEVDHVDPVVPLDRAGADMPYDEIIDRIWCDPNNLAVLCKPCHALKTADEGKIRRANKKGKKINVTSETDPRPVKTNRTRATSRPRKRRAVLQVKASHRRKIKRNRKVR